MKSITIVLALAAISAVIAAPMAPDAVVPETSLLQTAAEANAEAWNNAKTAVATLLASGKDESACADLAGSILSEVQSVVKQKEELLATMADGSECPSEGQGVVDAAQGHLTEAQATKASADAAAATAASAPVDFGVYPLSNLAGLANNQCSMFENDAAYAAAKNAADTAASAAATAAADVTAAETAVEDAKTSQKAAIEKCECDTYTAYEAAYKSANTRSDADLEAWKKGQHMKCVLAGSDPSACDVGSPPEVTKRALAEGVDASACAAPWCMAQNNNNGATINSPAYGSLPGRWWAAPKDAYSCDKLCGECGKTFDVESSKHHGNAACMSFYPGANAVNAWESIECGQRDSTGQVGVCNGANGNQPSASFNDGSSCTVFCACK